MANKRKHIYPLFTEVAFLTPNGEVMEGEILSRLHKLPKSGNSQKEEPYYIISNYGPAVYENDIVPMAHKNELLGASN
jgi:hypothetical protein